MGKGKSKVQRPPFSFDAGAFGGRGVPPPRRPQPSCVAAPSLRGVTLVSVCSLCLISVFFFLPHLVLIFFVYHLQPNKGERLRLQCIMDRETSTTSPLLNDTVGPGRGPAADYFVMDLGTVADIMLRDSIYTAGLNYIDKKNTFPCLYCVNNKQKNGVLCFICFVLLAKCSALANCSPNRPRHCILMGDLRIPGRLLLAGAPEIRQSKH